MALKRNKNIKILNTLTIDSKYLFIHVETHAFVGRVHKIDGYDM